MKMSNLRKDVSNLTTALLMAPKEFKEEISAIIDNLRKSIKSEAMTAIPHHTKSTKLMPALLISRSEADNNYDQMYTTNIAG